MWQSVTRTICGLTAGASLTLAALGVAHPLVFAQQSASAPGLLETDLDNAASIDAGQPETIQERYPNRQIKVERQVAQDDQGNYFNHGLWTMWDENGRMLGQGQYEHGQRQGKWTRWFAPGEGELFQGAVYREFEPPFISQATFVDDQLHGPWIIMDARKREVSAWEFRNGKRHGASIWWYPGGQKWREVMYRDGELHGDMLEWGPDEELIRKEAFVDGRRHGVHVEWYAPGVKKIEAEYLFAREIIEAADDWWNGTTRARVTGKDGKDERHGIWISYDRNGQKILEGRYHHDVPVGKFIWWHSNGQKSIEGGYVDGLQDGPWSWWYPNGQKQISGYYGAGFQVEQWTWWDKDGKVASSVRYADGTLSTAQAQQDVRSTSQRPALAVDSDDFRDAVPGTIVEVDDRAVGQQTDDEQSLRVQRPPLKLSTPRRR